LELFIKEEDIEAHLRDKEYSYEKGSSVWAAGITIGLPVPTNVILNFSDSGILAMGVDSSIGKFEESDIFLNNKNIKFIGFRKKFMSYRLQIETDMTIDGFENVDLEFNIKKRIADCTWHSVNLRNVMAKYSS
jgi:hypothetical protein